MVVLPFKGHMAYLVYKSGINRSLYTQTLYKMGISLDSTLLMIHPPFNWKIQLLTYIILLIFNMIKENVGSSGPNLIHFLYFDNLVNSKDFKTLLGI